MRMWRTTIHFHECANPNINKPRPLLGRYLCSLRKEMTALAHKPTLRPRSTMLRPRNTHVRTTVAHIILALDKTTNCYILEKTTNDNNKISWSAAVMPQTKRLHQFVYFVWAKQTCPYHPRNLVHIPRQNHTSRQVLEGSGRPYFTSKSCHLSVSSTPSSKATFKSGDHPFRRWGWLSLGFDHTKGH